MDKVKESLKEEIDLTNSQWSITVCITHHNRPKKLKRALEQLQKTASVPLTVRVHENGSTHDVNTALKAMADDGLIDELICTDENLGIAGSRHLLLEPDEIDSEFALVLDDDMYVSDGWDAAMLSVIASEPDVGIVGAPFMVPSSRDIRDGGQIITWSNGYPVLDSQRDVLIRNHVDYSLIADPDTQYIFVDDVPMGSSLVRRDVLKDVPITSGQTFEDISFSLDVVEVGWDIAMTCETVFYHDKRSEDNTELTQTNWNAKRSGYRDFCQNRELRFALGPHLLHQFVFAIPNWLLWTISDVKNGRIF